MTAWCWILASPMSTRWTCPHPSDTNRCTMLAPIPFAPPDRQLKWKIWSSTFSDGSSQISKLHWVEAILTRRFVVMNLWRQRSYCLVGDQLLPCRSTEVLRGLAVCTKEFRLVWSLQNRWGIQSRERICFASCSMRMSAEKEEPQVSVRPKKSNGMGPRAY